MALTTWIEQTYKLKEGTEVTICEGMISLRDGDSTIWLEPKTQEQAHEVAFVLRQSARRMEEKGRGLPRG
jgi:hypothetical protein